MLTMPINDVYIEGCYACYALLVDVEIFSCKKQQNYGYRINAKVEFVSSCLFKIEIDNGQFYHIVIKDIFFQIFCVGQEVTMKDD